MTSTAARGPAGRRSWLEPLLLDILLDRPLTKSIAADHPLTWDHFLQPG